MDIQQLRHLLAAVQYGNMVKAADESHISQSGLSRSIKSLETRLGVPLLVRKSKGVEPTVYGLSLLRRAQVIISEAAHSIREIRAIEQAQVGDITLGITPNFAQHLVPKVIAELAMQRPGVRISVVAASFLDLVEKLKMGDIDFAFGLLGAIEPSPDLHLEEIMESHSRVIARAGHPLLEKSKVGVDELSRVHWALPSSENFQRDFLNFFYVRGQTIPAQSLKTDSIALLKRVVGASDLLTVLSEDAVRDELDEGTLMTIACETPADFARVGFLLRAHTLMTPQMRLLMDRIRVASQAVPPAARLRSAAA